MRIFVSTHPFSQTSPIPRKLLQENDFLVQTNPYSRKISSDELAEEIKDSEILIAGTEKITRKILENAPKLKLISRVGIGLDGIDFDLCKEFGVKVAYTPDAPTIAVAELCVAMMLDVARKVTETSNALKQGVWHRHMGTLLYGKTVGIIGMGRIGKTLIHLLSSFNVNFKVHDIQPDVAFGRIYNVDFVSLEELLEVSDIVSVNVPLKSDTFNMITSKHLNMMKKEALLVNTARGGIVNEDDLYNALDKGIISGAGVDVFEEEPYCGQLTDLDNIILTCHMGASTISSRTAMEVEAVEEAIRFRNGTSLKNEVYGNE